MALFTLLCRWFAFRLLQVGLVLMACMFSLATLAQPTPEQVAKLVASDGNSYEYFARSIAVSGNTALISAGNEYTESVVYVFTLNNGVWSQTQKLIASDGTVSDSFGQSVYLLGNTALIGAPGHDANGIQDKGSAYVFTLNNGVWSQTQKLTASDGQAGDQFGYSVALSGNTALIGAKFDDIGDQYDQGSVYTFIQSGNNWTQTAKLVASDGFYGDNFGHSVDLSGQTAIIGAVDDNNGVGRTYVFTLSSGGWTQTARLEPSDWGDVGYYGHSVAIDGNTIIVGAYLDDAQGNLYQGSAYVFTLNNGVWSQTQKLTASDGQAGDQFGYSVALSADTAVIGAYRDQVGSNRYQGSGYVFALNNGSWQQVAKFTASDGTADDSFGSSVVIEGSTAIIGAIEDNSYQGSAYIYNLTTLTVPSVPATPGGLVARFASQTADTSTIQLSWQDNSFNEQGFVVEVSTDGFVNRSVDTLPSNSTQYNYQIARGESDSLYSFRLLAYNSLGASPYSNTDTTTVVAQGVNLAPVLARIGNKTVLIGQTIAFTALATDADSDQNLSFSLIDPVQGASINSSTGDFSFTPVQPGTYVFKVRVTDNGTTPLSDEEQFQIFVQEVALRIDCGSSNSITIGSKTFQADGYVTSNSIARTFTTGDIAGTTEDVIYKSMRSGDSFAYYIPVANGRYQVELNFAELYFTQVGERVFSVNIEGGKTELVNFDVIAQAGGKNRAVSRSFPISVTDENLAIIFSSQVSKAMISAIQITPIPANPSARVDDQEQATDPLAGSLIAYPNPFTNQLTVSLTTPQPGKVTLSLTDLRGQVLYRMQYQHIGKDRPVQISLPDVMLAPGLYLLQATNADGHQQVVKVVRQ
ncbi:malectin domain-containing carbohydrate-binding protein [Cytophagaceae bacterium DM2B3-1]|uniref:Malectin domain-containing carbohydrate-binding protein n=1 Tax=Xanthocytophaga flava TaxID=3048013 RepID=A0ABT7CWE2_9BACT|nr:malectin domain-containing carbohydrate-binding protein [Xanthocytophaga flavus]MDJ1498094.1 malectin domain-containing carbohydrate-binding protein [Xanthocytophaga flavus]